MRNDRIAIRSRSYAQRFPVPPWRYRLARAAELRLGDFHVQNLANAAWALTESAAGVLRIVESTLMDLMVISSRSD